MESGVLLYIILVEVLRLLVLRLNLTSTFATTTVYNARAYHILLLVGMMDSATCNN